jgi:hypothetical protein
MEPLRSRIFFFNHTLLCKFLIKKEHARFICKNFKLTK